MVHYLLIKMTNQIGYYLLVKKTTQSQWIVSNRLVQNDQSNRLLLVSQKDHPIKMDSFKSTYPN
jgi:hypothetical protein